MKRLLYIIAVLSVMPAVSCMKERVLTDPPFEGTFDLRFNFPVHNTVRTRGEVEEGMLANMYVLVFDHNGSFMYRVQGEQSGQSQGSFRIRFPRTDPDFPAESRKRIVHFIANYEWTGFSDVRNHGRHENEVVSQMSVTGDVVTYWQRVVLDEGIVEGAFPDPVELLGNTARISVVDNSASLTGHPVFALDDRVTHGTVAPFNTVTLEFDESSVVQSPSVSRIEIREEDFIPTALDNEGMGGNSIVCYERTNSQALYPMNVIFKGRFGDEDHDSYYKIDIVEEGVETLMDIQRNRFYIIDIQEITGPGNKTLQEAVNSPASNNLLYSIVLQPYTSISDGISALNVETTDRTFVHAGMDFRIGFSYFPLISGAEDNTNVEVALEHSDPLREVIGSYTVVRDAGSACIAGTTSATLPQYDINMARFIVKTERSGVVLRRVINLRLRSPSVFGDVYMTPAPVPAASGERADLHFSIPNTVRIRHFPMYIYVTSTSLTPNLDPGFDQALTLDYQVPGRYRYRYIARAPGDHTVHFKTNSGTATPGSLLLEADLFTTVTVDMSVP